MGFVKPRSQDCIEHMAFYEIFPTKEAKFGRSEPRVSGTVKLLLVSLNEVKAAGRGKKF